MRKLNTKKEIMQVKQVAVGIQFVGPKATAVWATEWLIITMTMCTYVLWKVKRMPLH